MVGRGSKDVVGEGGAGIRRGVEESIGKGDVGRMWVGENVRGMGAGGA